MILLNQIFFKYRNILGRKGLKLTKRQFLKCLYSEAYAAYHYPKINQHVWHKVIDVLMQDVFQNCPLKLAEKLLSRFQSREIIK